MKFKTLNGKEKLIKNSKKFLINWDAKSRSKVQWRVKQFLFSYWKHDIVFEELRVAGTRLSLDFYNANKKIAVEVQGKQHQQFNKFFHNNNRLNWLAQLKRDDLKMKFCLTNGILLVEIYEDEEINHEIFSKQGVEL
jgi:very-short-patch-repair endonuclease